MIGRLALWSTVMWFAFYCNPVTFWLQDAHRYMSGGFVS